MHAIYGRCIPMEGTVVLPIADGRYAAALKFSRRRKKRTSAVAEPFLKVTARGKVTPEKNLFGRNQFFPASLFNVKIVLF